MNFGWLAAVILTVTISKQVIDQARADSADGVSLWLYGGQLAANVGFIVHSVRTGATVFLVANSVLLLAAAAGLAITLRQRRRAESHSAANRPAERDHAACL
jgi:hypothetical protein